MGRLAVYELGRVEYEDGLKLQKLVGEARARELCADSLLLLEHPPVLTLGRGAKGQNIVAEPAQLAKLGVEVFETDRGGDVTYHGPGQIVGYPIFRLPPDRHDVRRYIRDLEEALIRALKPFGIAGERIPQWPGVWVVGAGTETPQKIAAIGVHISRWQTSHGFALNVNTDLSHFQLIVPCGIQEAGVTSMQRQLSRPVEIEEVQRELSRSFGEVFGAEVEVRAPESKTISVAVVQPNGGNHQVLLLQRTQAKGAFWQIVTGRVGTNETPRDAAAREVLEETGQALRVTALGYEHAFPLGNAVPPAIVQETAFAAFWKNGMTVQIDPNEHDDWRWVSVEEALAALPFKGLRRAVLLAATSAIEQL